MSKSTMTLEKLEQVSKHIKIFIDSTPEQREQISSKLYEKNPDAMREFISLAQKLESNDYAKNKE